MLVYLYKNPTIVNCIIMSVIQMYKYMCIDCGIIKSKLCYIMVVSVISQIMITHSRQLALAFVWLQIQFIYASWTE